MAQHYNRVRMTRKTYFSEYFLLKSGRCTKVSNSQPAPISGNVINQILYLDPWEQL